MSEFTVTDCLVLKLEEMYPEKNNLLDTTVYILYDIKRCKYIIRGQRRPTPNYKSCPYSFECKCIKDVVHFLQYVICKNNVVNETLFNYNNLPYNSNNITYEFLKEFENRNNEVSGYDDIKITYKRLMRNLSMLETISNNF